MTGEDGFQRSVLLTDDRGEDGLLAQSTDIRLQTVGERWFSVVAVTDFQCSVLFLDERRDDGFLSSVLLTYDRRGQIFGVCSVER